MWEAKNEYPDLSGANLISIDTETKDPNLEKKGPGYFRKDGYVIGFSVGTDTGFLGYYPIRHPEGNVAEPEKALAWLKELMKLRTPKVGANLLYDMLWLKKDLDIDMLGEKIDVQVAEPLIDENRKSFSLASLSETWLGESKGEDLLYTAGVEVFDFSGEVSTVVKKVKGLLWKLPAKYVGAYAEKDADLPIRIWEKQKSVLERDNLMRVFSLECEVLDVLFKMQLRGIRIDTEKAEQARNVLQTEYAEVSRKLSFRCGFDVDIWSGDSVSKACDTMGIEFKTTEKGNPSFQGKWLLDHPDPFIQMINEARTLDRCGGVFIERNLLGLAIDGRIHPQFFQVKNDRFGTGTGRISSANPNAQNFPGRHARMKKLVRGIILPEEGEELLVADYKAQEPRVTVHYAASLRLPGGVPALNRYIEDPKTDYHQIVADLAQISRNQAKTVNLGLMYGMGIKKLAGELKVSVDEAKEVKRRYISVVPFAQDLSDLCKNKAETRGYVRTILGRRVHYDLWGPRFAADKVVPKKLQDALKQWPDESITRYFTYRALNAVIQGSSADMLKVAMVLCNRAGYTPMLTVHDENDYSISSRQAAKDIRQIMIEETRNFLGLSVPLDVDMKIGKNWGETEGIC